MDEFEFLLEDRIAKIQAIDSQFNLRDNAYISFSGGKDSTILHYLIDLALPNNKIPRVYADTGIEFKMVRDFVYKLKESDDRIITIKPSLNIKKTLNEYGYPFKSKDFAYRYGIFQRNGVTKGIKRFLEFDGLLGCPKKLKFLFENRSLFDFKVSDKCCLKMKEQPIEFFSKKTNRKVAIIGICGGEGGRRERNIKGCIFEKQNGKVKFYPLKVVDKDWEQQFIDKFNIRLCDIYYPPYNFKRTGCKGCPFDLDLQDDLETMYKLLPNEYKQCLSIWKPVYDEYIRIGYRLKQYPHEIGSQLTIDDL